ncbi:MAG TPA: transglutaminase domain-containing protein, partial [Chloroflexia bacterium]|nr:transglutaminase domain-containing protein [Chloroflexia bacterium]
VPPLAKLQALNLQRGGTPYAEPLDGLSVKRTDDQSNPVEISSSLYLNNSGDFTLTLESPLSKGNAARDRFETTDTGKKVLADIKKLEDAVKGNKVTYTLTNGLPSELHYSGYEPNYDDLTGAILPQPVNTGESYSTVASRYRYDQESLRKASTEYPDWVTERYLTLPDNFSPAIKAMAEDLTAGAANPYDKTMALVNYLNSLNYTTDPPPVPAGRDEIEFFLMDSKSGYCVHFSSSLALMLRSMGIPTRIATGFIGGDYDAATNSYIVRGSAAHAWTQVYFPGYGWVDFEPTPGREGIQRPVDPSAIPPAPVATPSADSAAPGSTTPDGSTEQDKGRKLLDPEANANNGGAANSQQSKEFPTWLLVTLSLLLAGGVLYFARWYYLKKQFALPDPSPLVVYNRLSRSARKAGLRGRSGMTPFEYADYLCLNLPAAAPSIRAMVNAYVRKRYYPIGEDMDAGQRKKHLEELRDAESKVRKAEAAGHDPRPEDLWVLFRANTDVYKDERQMRALWEDFQETLLAHKREKRINRVTPEFIRKLREWRASRQVKRA